MVDQIKMLQLYNKERASELNLMKFIEPTGDFDHGTFEALSDMSDVSLEGI